MSHTAFSALPFLPLNPVWVLESRAFSHSDGRVGKAFVLVLIEMWRRGGSLPASKSSLMQAIGMDVAFVDEFYDDLVCDFKMNDEGRWEFPPLSRVCQVMGERFSKEIESFAISSALSVQSPQEFGLSVVEGVKAKAVRGVTSIPKSFSPCAESKAHCRSLGYTDDMIRGVLDKFIDFSQARGTKSKDWDAAFRLFVTRELEFRSKSSGPQMGFFPAASDMSAQRQSRGDMLSNKNLNMLLQVQGGGL